LQQIEKKIPGRKQVGKFMFFETRKQTEEGRVLCYFCQIRENTSFALFWGKSTTPCLENEFRIEQI
jgi:hypothetical protein